MNLNKLLVPWYFWLIFKIEQKASSSIYLSCGYGNAWYHQNSLTDSEKGLYRKVYTVLTS